MSLKLDVLSMLLAKPPAKTGKKRYTIHLCLGFGFWDFVLETWSLILGACNFFTSNFILFTLNLIIFAS